MSSTLRFSVTFLTVLLLAGIAGAGSPVITDVTYAMGNTPGSSGIYPVSINVNSDRIVAGEPYYITVTGKPDTPYYLWIRKSSGESSATGSWSFFGGIVSGDGIRMDSHDGQNSIGSYQYHDGNGRSILEDVTRSDSYDRYNLYAIVTTSSSGKRTVRVYTDGSEPPGTYIIRAEGREEVDGAYRYTSSNATLAVSEGYYNRRDALTVQRYTATMVPGESGAEVPVTVALDLAFPNWGYNDKIRTTFPSDNDLEMRTELKNATWKYVLDLDGVSNPRSGAYGTVLTIRGFDLSYKVYIEEVLHVEMTGKGNAEDISRGALTLLSVNQTTADGSVVMSNAFSRLSNEPSPNLKYDWVFINPNESPVARGNPVSLTLTGKPNTLYYLWFKGTSRMDGSTGNQPPMFVPDQPGVYMDTPDLVRNAAGPVSRPIGLYRFFTDTGSTVKDDVATDTGPDALPYNGTRYYCAVLTPDSGISTIDLVTSPMTHIRQNISPFGETLSPEQMQYTYTIHVENITYSSPDRYTFWDYNAELTVGPEESRQVGTVTIHASGNHTYTLGDEIELSGINTESRQTYLFLYGPNLPNTGSILSTLYPRDNAVTDGVAGTFQRVDVRNDNTWSWNWDTRNVELDAGSYSVYAVGQPRDRAHLWNVSHEMVSIIILKPYLSSGIFMPTVAKGDSTTIVGTATGRPSGLQVWLFGRNASYHNITPVNADSTYRYLIPPEVTQALAPGQNFAIVQHPMINRQFDIDICDAAHGGSTTVCSYDVYSGGIKNLFSLQGSNGRYGIAAADALIEALNDPNFEDTYSRLAFTVEEPNLIIDPVSNQQAGKNFTITARTNLAAGDEILVQVIPTSFTPAQKSTTVSNPSFAGGVVQVIHGDDGMNRIEYTVDGSALTPDEYIVTMSAIGPKATGTAIFSVLPSSSPTVTASFTTDTTTGTAPLVVRFNDTSINAPTNWFWEFGDGSTSIQQNVTHIYNSAGTYTVNLTVTNAAGSNRTVKQGYISVGPAAITPEASFISTPLTGRVPLAVQFTDRSTNTPTGWAWFFGDEDYKQPWTLVDADAGWPARQYQESVVTPDGSIIMMGGFGDNGYLHEVWRSSDGGKSWSLVTANPGWPARGRFASVVTPDGSIVIMGGFNPDDGALNDTWISRNNGMTWMLMNANSEWGNRVHHSAVALPDGSIVLTGGEGRSSVMNDTWISHNQGATWTLRNASSGWSTRYGHGSVALPDGSIVLTGGGSGISVMNDTWISRDQGATWTLRNASSGWLPRAVFPCIAMPDRNILLLGGAGPIKSMNDVWMSADEGITWTQANASPGWAGRFGHSAVVIPDGSVLLMGGTSGPFLNDSWSFAPAGSNARNPLHTYTSPGTFTVTLRAYNPAGAGTAVKTNSISATLPPSPVAAFRANKTTGDPPFTARFMDQSENSPTRWTWDFGDSEVSTEQNPVHRYANAGNYTVNLTVSNNAGSNTTVRWKYITVIPPVVDSNPFVVTEVQMIKTGSVQNVSIDTGNANVTKTGNVVTISNSTGFSTLQITLAANTTESGAGTVNGTVEAVRAVTEPVTVPIESIGTPTVQIAINMTEMPADTAAITQTITKEPDTTAQTSFTLAASTDGKQIDDIAYTLNIVKTNLANAGDGGIIQSATLTLTVSPAWVAEHGGIGHIVVMRRADDGTTQVLVPQQTGIDAYGNIILSVDSPKGLSTFILAALSTASADTSSSIVSSGGYFGSSDSGSAPAKSVVSTQMKSSVDPNSYPWTSQVVKGPTHITQIDMQPIGTFKDLFIQTEKPESLPAGIPSPGVPVYELHKIDLYHATSDDINQAKIEFTVSPMYLESQKMSFRDVQLFRFHNNGWEKLPTEYMGMKNGEYLYRATSPGFSYFATVLVKDAAIIPATTLPTTIVPASAKTTNVMSKNTITPPLEKTQSASMAPVTRESPGIPAFLYALGIAGAAVVCICGFAVNRWRIRRQNPALFDDEPFWRFR